MYTQQIGQASLTTTTMVASSILLSSPSLIAHPKPVLTTNSCCHAQSTAHTLHSATKNPIPSNPRISPCPEPELCKSKPSPYPCRRCLAKPPPPLQTRKEAG
ncbi:hypothetical protein M0R45_001620 [Rubus argutus]|uniref:Uncharacterized protein n=1 Tax=Rubus argutus TaxID=59490 RepID=A0AAW1VGD5_RUBAR